MNLFGVHCPLSCMKTRIQPLPWGSPASRPWSVSAWPCLVWHATLAGICACRTLPPRGVASSYPHNDETDENAPLRSGSSGRLVFSASFPPFTEACCLHRNSRGTRTVFKVPYLICLLISSSRGRLSGHPSSQCSAAFGAADGTSVFFWIHPLLVGATTGLFARCSSSSVGPSPSIHPKMGVFLGVHPRVPLSHWTHASHGV